VSFRDNDKKYLWNYCLHMGHTFLVFAEFMRHERQKEWPHSVVMGILKRDMQIGQFSYSGIYMCIGRVWVGWTI